jgi:hypothetical protein
MNKDELRGFVKGAIASFNYYSQINTDKCLNFIILEVNGFWLIEFTWLIVDVPSSNLDPTDDNSVTKYNTEKLRVPNTLSNSNLFITITDALDVVHDSDLITERSELC